MRAILRQSEWYLLENAKHAVLENTGQVSVIKESDDDKAMTILLFDMGCIEHTVLESHNLEESWLI